MLWQPDFTDPRDKHSVVLVSTLMFGPCCCVYLLLNAAQGGVPVQFCAGRVRSVTGSYLFGSVLGDRTPSSDLGSQWVARGHLIAILCACSTRPQRAVFLEGPISKRYAGPQLRMCRVPRVQGSNTGPQVSLFLLCSFSRTFFLCRRRRRWQAWHHLTRGPATSLYPRRTWRY